MILNKRTLIKTSPTLRRGSGPPSFTGTVDDLYYDTANNYLYIANGGSWYRVAFSLYVPAGGTPAGWLFNDSANSGQALMIFD